MNRTDLRGGSDRTKTLDRNCKDSFGFQNAVNHAMANATDLADQMDADSNVDEIERYLALDGTRVLPSKQRRAPPQPGFGISAGPHRA